MKSFFLFFSRKIATKGLGGCESSWGETRVDFGHPSPEQSSSTWSAANRRSHLICTARLTKRRKRNSASGFGTRQVNKTGAWDNKELWFGKKWKAKGTGMCSKPSLVKWWAPLRIAKITSNYLSLIGCSFLSIWLDVTETIIYMHSSQNLLSTARTVPQIEVLEWYDITFYLAG